MKFLPLRDFDDVTGALNFDTPDCHVIGGCDLYTTKAAGSDKKLYKTIENSLESQHASLLQLSNSLSPPHASSAAESLNLSRSSPFGPLSQTSSRRTFAYLIATLNASHPDYDFSHLLRPADFRRERNLKSVMNTLDSTLYNLRPRPAGSFTGSMYGSTANVADNQSSGPGQIWGPRMWGLIDKEMALRDCSIYCYAPEEDPYDGEEGAIWSFNYFFFNKQRKRVCYIHLRGLSVISHSPVQRTPLPKRKVNYFETRSSDFGAKKRARYWLGDKANGDVRTHQDDSGDEDGMIDDYIEDEVDVEDVIDQGDEMDYDFDSDEEIWRDRSRSKTRGVSEEIVGRMEV